MKNLGFLFLGGAKRVSVARMIRRASEMSGCECRIYGYETDTRVPLACEGEIVTGRLWSDADLYEHLHEVVKEKRIDAVIPFVDKAVGVAAEYARRYPGEVYVPVGEALMAEKMFDKVESAALFESLGIPVPRTYRPGDPCLRLIAKPRHGSASKGIISISSLQALDDILNSPVAGDYLVQERIDRRAEYSVDCYVGVRSGEIKTISPRKRVEVVGGEASRTVTVAREDVSALAEEVLRKTGLRGAVTVQIIEDLDTGRLMLMEVNPRLGGGVVCSVHAGADIPAMIVAETLGKEAQKAVAEPGVEIARYMQEVVFRH